VRSGLNQAPISPGPVVQCLNCEPVYINPREDLSSVVGDGPVLGVSDAALLVSSDSPAVDVPIAPWKVAREADPSGSRAAGC